MTPSELSALREELRTQDNRFTADPLFVVFGEHRVGWVGPEYTDDFEWFQADDHSIAADSDEVKILERLRADGRPSLSADLTSCASVTRLSASLRPLVLLAKEPRTTLLDKAGTLSTRTSTSRCMYRNGRDDRAPQPPDEPGRVRFHEPRQFPFPARLADAGPRPCSAARSLCGLGSHHGLAHCRAQDRGDGCAAKEPIQ